MSELFNGIKVFSATMARDREELGEKVTAWMRNRPECKIVDRLVTQSSDNEFHCVTITLFYNEDPIKKREEASNGNGPAPTRLNFKNGDPNEGGARGGERRAQGSSSRT